MSEPCDEIRPECAHALKEIAVSLARIDERGKKLDEVHAAVMGNGTDPPKGLIAQVAALRATMRNTWKVIGACVGIVLTILAIVRLAG